MQGVQKIAIFGQYLGNNTRYSHNYNGILTGTHTYPRQVCHLKRPRVTLSDSEIFNEYNLHIIGKKGTHNPEKRCA